MKTINVKEFANEVNSNGFGIIRNYVDETDIDNAIDLCSMLTDMYSEQGLYDRLFYKREESHNRQGDAVMVSLKRSEELPSIELKTDLLLDYNDIIGELTGKKVNETSRSMMNIQQYFEESLPVWDHYDGMFFDFHHGETDKYGENPLIVDNGLLPRYVMVVVLTNENDGKGTYVRKHDSDERIDVELHPGDMIVFDNINMRHGVPALEHPRMMLGFRNFDHEPYHFVTKETDGYEPLHDEINPGYIRAINEEQSVKLQVDELKQWKNGKAEEQLKKPAAF